MCLSRVVAETYVRPSSRFVHEGECATFFDVIARARRLEEIAIGVITNGTHPSKTLWICASVGARALTGLAGLFVQPPSFGRPQRNCRNYVRHPSSPSERKPVLRRLLAVTPVRRV